MTNRHGAFNADLHTHSTRSDGKLTPSELVARAVQMRVDVLALTDHDTMDGLQEAGTAAQDAGIRFVPGIELGVNGDEQVHILGYGVNDSMQSLGKLVSDFRQDRAQRLPRFLEKLRTLNMPLSQDDLIMPDGVAFSRPILADAMMRSGYTGSIAEAFDRFIGKGRPAYVPRMHVKAEDVVAMLRAEGAVPVLAHPGLPDLKDVISSTFVHCLMDAGLMGIEVYHPAHTAENVAHWLQFARQHQLMVTGGSDYHGRVDALHGEVGSQRVAWHTVQDDTNALLEAVGDL